MASKGYKKYMKKDVRQGHPLIKIFVISFFGMLLLSTFIINSFARKMTVDTSVGDYKEQQYDESEGKKIVDMSRLQMIQNEDQGRNFADLMKNPSDEKSSNNENTETQLMKEFIKPSQQNDSVTPVMPQKEVIYKVFIGTYTSAEQAKVAKEIIQEADSGLSPIVKCIGANDYTLQVGIFKNKQSADSMLNIIQRNNLPGRIVQE